MDPTDFLPSLNKTEEKWLERVQQKVHFCPTCQPYDGGEYVWIHGEECELEDIFEELNCPENYRDKIAEHISCPNCGANNFSRYDTVGKEDKYDAAVNDHLEAASKKFGKKILELQNYLEEYPTLGLNNSFGKKLFKEITSGKAPSTRVLGKWFRARNVNGSQVYSSKDLWAPDIGISGEGRYNHAGQKVLYLAYFEETAIAEVLGKIEESALIWMQQYEIEEIDNLLDLRSDWENFAPSFDASIVAVLSSGVLAQSVEDRATKWKPQYFVTRFIADCARHAGYKGIRYTSTKDFGDNIVVFDPDNIKVSPIGKPRIYIHDHKEREISKFPF